MATKIDICNAALIHIGVDPITALTDDNKRAILCNNRYDAMRDYVLRDHTWNFAIKRDEISHTDTINDTWGRSIYRFLLPLDCVKVIGITDQVNGRSQNYKYKIEGRYLITGNVDSIQLKYISNAVDEVFFDSAFSECLSLKIAIAICYSLTQNNTLKNQLEQSYTLCKQESRSLTSQEVSPDIVEASVLELSRTSSPYIE